MAIDRPCHAVAIFGGACAGSTVADILAAAGCQVVVFDQNVRPYGKIEDGLPRWHDKQRLMEYRKIDERLTRPGVTFVPSTKLGKDVDFLDVAREWGWSCVVLANGAWRDRPMDTPGAGDVVERGLVYQNPFVYWFNHKNEAGYSGTRYDVPPGPVVIGGGLASIDVIKIFQLELYVKALRARGVAADEIEMEHAGIPAYCKQHGVEDPASLGVTPGVLVYRRRVEDMPLSPPLPKDAPEKAVAKAGEVRKKILAKCQANFLFEVRPQTVTKELLIEGGRLRGVVLSKAEVKGRDAVAIPGTEETLRTDLVVSSIGSIPEPLPGVEMQGTFYKFKDWDTGEYGPLPGVFATGNVITGQGNIKASLDHGREVAKHLLASYLADPATAPAAETAAAVAGSLARKAPLPPAQVEALLERARRRQREVGFDDYAAWMKRVTPPDMQ